MHLSLYIFSNVFDVIYREIGVRLLDISAKCSANMSIKPVIYTDHDISYSCIVQLLRVTSTLVVLPTNDCLYNSLMQVP